MTQSADPWAAARLARSEWRDPDGARWRVIGIEPMTHSVVLSGPNGDHCVRWVGLGSLETWTRLGEYDAQPLGDVECLVRGED